MVQRAMDRLPRPLPRNAHDWSGGRPPPYYPTYTYRPSASKSSHPDPSTTEPSEASEAVTVVASGRYVPPPRGTQPRSSILRGSNTIQLRKNSTTRNDATQTSLADTPDAGAVTIPEDPDPGSTGAAAASAAFPTYQTIPPYPGMQMPMPPPYGGVMPPFNPFTMPPPSSAMPPPPYSMPYDGPPPWPPGFNPQTASMAAPGSGNGGGTTTGEAVTMEPQPAPAPAVGAPSAPVPVAVPPPPVPAEPAASIAAAAAAAAPSTRVQHVCAGCGKARSMSYHNQRQLGNNSEPLSDYCARCVKDHTSSEEEETEKEEGKKRSRSRGKRSKRRHRRQRSKYQPVEESERTESSHSSDESQENHRRENSPGCHRRSRSSRHKRAQKPGLRIRISNSPRGQPVESEVEYPTDYADLRGTGRRAYVEPEPEFEDWTYTHEDHAAGGWGDYHQEEHHHHPPDPFVEVNQHQAPSWEEVVEPPSMMTEAERRMAMHPLPFRHRRPEDVIAVQETAPPIRRVSSPVRPTHHHHHQRHRSDQLQHQVIHRIEHPVRAERRSRTGIQQSNFHDWVSTAAEKFRHYPAEIEATEDYYRNYSSYPIHPRRHTTAATAAASRVHRSTSRSETHHQQHHHHRREMRDEVVQDARDEQELGRRMRRVQIHDPRAIAGAGTATTARPAAGFSVSYKHQPEDDDESW